MQFDYIKQCLKRHLSKDGLVLITTRESSRDYWDLGRYSIIDDRMHLVERDVDIYDLAKERGLLPAQALI